MSDLAHAIRLELIGQRLVGVIDEEAYIGLQFDNDKQLVVFKQGEWALATRIDLKKPEDETL